MPDDAAPARIAEARRLIALGQAMLREEGLMQPPAHLVSSLSDAPVAAAQKAEARREWEGSQTYSGVFGGGKYIA